MSEFLIFFAKKTFENLSVADRQVYERLKQPQVKTNTGHFQLVYPKSAKIFGHVYTRVCKINIKSTLNTKLTRGR